jgi:putative tryptophan/tyrosine transport system substrate-binding protein
MVSRPRRLLLLLAALALCRSAAGAAVRPTVAVLKSSSIPAFEQATAAILAGLARDPLQPEILTFDLEGDVANGAAALAKIHDADARLVIAVGSLATSVALDDPAPLPTVFSMVLYPRQSGFLGRAGRHVTGASLDVPPEVPFAYLRRLLPGLKRVGVLYSPSETGGVVAEARRAAREQGIELVAQPVEDPAAAVPALAELSPRVDAVWAVADSHVFGPHTTSALILEALHAGKPLFGLSVSQVRAGAIAALATDSEDVGRQTADLAARALHGADPSSLAMTRPTRVRLVLNLRVARNLGIDVSGDLEAEAGEVMR